MSLAIGQNHRPQMRFEAVELLGPDAPVDDPIPHLPCIHLDGDDLAVVPDQPFHDELGGKHDHPSPHRGPKHDGLGIDRLQGIVAVRQGPSPGK